MTSLLQNSLFLRIVSALVLMPVVLGALIFGGWFFVAMIAVAIIISLKEWYKMSLMMPDALLIGAAGALYIIFCFMAFSHLRLMEFHGAGLALALILSIWASDSGAYFAGKTIGGPKMAPSISPNKTWAGLIGGVISSTAALVLYATYVGPAISFQYHDLRIPSGASILELAILGVFITLSGQAGDLLVSKMKRKVGVKDTGHLIPGHGGLLDRIDSLLLASIFFLIGIKVIGL